MLEHKNYTMDDGIKLGLNYLKNADLLSLKNGRYEVLGNKVYVSIQDYTSKPVEEGRFEAHRKYVDIQYIIEGEEKIGVLNISDCSAATDYDEEKDIVFLEPKNVEEIKFVNLKKNEYAVFYPQDAHMPCIFSQSPSYVKKAVVKVAV